MRHVQCIGVESRRPGEGRYSIEHSEGLFVSVPGFNATLTASQNDRPTLQSTLETFAA